MKRKNPQLNSYRGDLLSKCEYQQYQKEWLLDGSRTEINQLYMLKFYDEEEEEVYRISFHSDEMYYPRLPQPQTFKKHKK